MGSHLFERYIGVDYSGAETPTSSLRGLRVFMADRGTPPLEVNPPPSPRKYWTRRGIAEWLAAQLSEDRLSLVGIDHGFSFPLAYFRQVWSVSASLPLASVRTLQEIFGKSLARTSFTLVMLGIAGAMALVLGVIGLYGVISYTVSQRRREIGIRLVLGAQQGELRRMFVRQGLVLAVIGVAIGLGAATLLTRLMTALLFGITALDPLTYIAVSLVLVAAAMAASYLPARRASAVDPVEALKAE